MFKRACPVLALLLLLGLFLAIQPLAMAQEVQGASVAASEERQTIVPAWDGSVGSGTGGGHRDLATDAEWDALQRINALRLLHGQAPLAMAEQLQPVAALRAFELDVNFSQTRPNEEAWYTAIDEAGIFYGTASEVIARPAVSGLRAVELWANNSDTRAVLLGESYTHIALAHNIRTDSWCALFIEGEPHRSLSVRPRGTHLLSMGGTLESLELIIRVRGSGDFFSYLPLKAAMVPDFDPYRAGYHDPLFSLGEVSVPLSIFIDFYDVDETHRYYDHIRFAVINRLFNGVSREKFDPDAPMTRAMFVTAMGRMARQMGLPIEGDHSIFADVLDDVWYTPYIGWAAERGLAQGYAGYFRVYDPITREQMATFLKRFLDYLEIELIPEEERPFFRDRFLVSAWAVESVDWAVSLGLINLIDRSFRGWEDALRSEVAHAMTVLIRDYGINQDRE